MPDDPTGSGFFGFLGQLVSRTRYRNTLAFYGTIGVTGFAAAVALGLHGEKALAFGCLVLVGGVLYVVSRKRPEDLIKDKALVLAEKQSQQFGTDDRPLNPDEFVIDIEELPAQKKPGSRPPSAPPLIGDRKGKIDEPAPDSRVPAPVRQPGDKEPKK